MAEETKSLELVKFVVQLTYITDVLGVVPKNPDVYKDWLATKEPKEDEAEMSIEHTEKKGWTGFYSDALGVYLLNYHFKGFFKNAASVLPETLGLRRKSGELMSARTVKGKVDQWLFIEPRVIYFSRDGAFLSKVDGFTERPIRVDLITGPRTALIRSDYIAAGSSSAFQVILLGNSPISWETLKIWLDYGRLMGVGQFRNGGYGNFSYTIEVAKD